MKTIAGSAKVKSNPPKGVYQGSWGGYEVHFKVGDQEWTAYTQHGIRSPDSRCTVTVKDDGTIDVETE